MDEGNDVTNGWPRQIVKIAEGDNRFDLDLEALKDILLQEDVVDKPVVVISVAGAFRKGKSFLLSFFLRYLRAKGTENWMGNENEPLSGFKWAPGRERVTNGIHMWSHPFLITLPDGTEVAVLLMDTQGTFDRKCTIKEHATVFALSTMMSSVLVYNLMNNIQEYDLEHLQLFTDYGKLALEDNETTPFQKLQFLLRDYPDINEFGEKGGLQLLEEILQIEPEQHDELKSLRKVIRSCFSDISCFLMPHPGKKVTSSGFQGCISDIDPDFIETLSVFVPSLLAPENLIIKNISGTNITAKEFAYYFSLYFGIFESGKLPAPQTILKAAVTADNLLAANEAKDLYVMKMNKFMELVSKDPNASTVALEEEHLSNKANALAVFNNSRKRGTKEDSKMFCNNLEQGIEEKFACFKERLESHQKIRSSASRTESLYIQLMMDLNATDNLSLNMEQWEKKHKEYSEMLVTQFCNEIKELSEVQDLFEHYKINLQQKLEGLFEKLKLQIQEKQDLESALAEIIQTYSNYMEIKCGLSVYHLQAEILQSYHLTAKEEAMQTFYCKSIVHDPTQASKLRNKLENEIQNVCAQYKKQNEMKGMYEKTLSEIIKEFKRKVADECQNFERDVEKCKEHISNCYQQVEKQTVQKFYKSHPQNGTELQNNYEDRLKSELKTTCKEFIETKLCEVVSMSLMDVYHTELDGMCDFNDKKVHPEDLYVQHLESRRKALDKFKNKTEGVRKNIYESHKRKLDDEITSAFEHYKGLNEGHFKIKMADWNKPHVQEWKKSAAEFQQEYYDLLQKKHDIQYSSSDTFLLEKHLGYAMFGPPEDLPGDQNGQTGYTQKQTEKIFQLCQIILAQNNRYKIKNLFLDFIFVSALINEHHRTYCVIHVRKLTGTDDDFYEFFDCRIRGYKNWNDFLSKNELPQCFMCFPRNGVYTAVEGKVVLDFDLSAACGIDRKVLSVLDIVATGIGMSGIVVGLASAGTTVAIPGAVVIGGVLAVIGTSTYGIVRKSMKQNDRAVHGQSLTDKEGRRHWYGIAADGINIVTMGGTAWLKTAIALGKALSALEISAVAALSASSSVVNGLGIINEVIYMKDKLINGELPTTLDAFQFASRMLFFTNSIIATHLALRMIECTSCAGTQLKMTNLLPLMKINKLGSILRKPLRQVKDFILNKCQKIVTDLFALYSKNISFDQFLKATHAYFSDLWDQMMKTVTIVCQTLGISSLNDIEIGGKKILSDGTLNQVRKFGSIILGVINEYKARFINAELRNSTTSQLKSESSCHVDEAALSNATTQFGNDFLQICVSTNKCDSPENFLNYVQFVKGSVEWNTILQELEYQRALTAAEKSSSHINHAMFDENYGIEGNRFQYFCNKTFEKLQATNMDGYYCQLKEAVDRNEKNSSATDVVNSDFFKLIDYDDVTVHVFHNWNFGDELPGEETWYEMLEQIAGINKDLKRYIMQKATDLVVIEMEKKDLDVKCVAIKIFENLDGELSGILITLHSI